MAQFLSTSITGSLTLSGSTTPITLPGTNARIEVGDPNGTDYSMNFRSNRYYYFQDNKVLYVQGTIIARNGIMDDGGPLALGHKSANIMYLSGSSVGIGTSTPIHDLHVNGDRLVFTQTGQTYTDGSTGLTGIGIRNTGTSAAYNAFGIQTGAGQAFQVRNNGDVRILRDLTVSGIVTAQEFHTEFVSASIVFSSGSTKFGNTVDDDHNFTGSLNVLAQSGASGLDIKRDANTYMNLNNSSTRNEFNFKSTTGLRFFHGSDSTSPLFISSSGNVGIGTTAPSQTLDVNGTALVRSGMYVANWIQNWGDGGTGLYFETDKVSLRTNGGTQQLVVSGSNGFVGIGTSTPARRLHIGGTGGSSGGIMLSPSSGDIEVQFQDSGTTNAYITLKDGTQQMRFRDDSANVLNVDFGTERVGIMTTAPTVALQIEGDVSASGYLKGDTLYALNDVVVADQILHYGDTDTNISFTDDQIVLNAGNVEFIRLSEGLTDQLIINEGGAALDVRIEGDGDTNLIRTDAANDRVGIGTASPTEKLTVGGNLRVVTSGTTYLKLRGSGDNYDLNLQSTQDEFIVSRGSTEHFRIDSNGNTGLSVAAPTHRLHVSGTYDVVKIEGSGSANSSSLFEVHGNNGLLFAIDDDLSDSLFSVNTIAGLPVIEAFSDNRVVMGAYNQNDFVISGSRVGIKTDIPEAELHISGATPQLFVGKMTGGSNNDGIYDDDHIVVGEGGSISIGAERRGDYAKQATTATGTTFRSRLNIWSDNQDHITFGGAHTHMVSAWEEWYTWINNDSANAGTFHLYHTNAKTEFARFTGGTGDGWYNGGDFGFGTTSPSAKVDIYTEGAYDSFNALALRAGNSLNASGSNQIIMSWDGGTQYRHAIKTRHNSGAGTGNAIDFYVWDQANDTTGTIGTLHTMTLENGNVGIGTTSPVYKLHIDAGAAIAARFQSTADAQIQLYSTNSWAGIQFVDSANNDHIWFNGANETFAIGGGGSNVAGKKLHVHGGMTIGSGIANITMPTNGLLVEGHVSASAFSGSFKGDGSGLQNVTATVSLAEVLGTGNDAGGNDIENVGALEAVTLNATGTISGSVINAANNAYFGGNVGIGTTTPSYKLVVAGEVGIDSYIRHNGDTDTYFGFNGVDSYKRYIAGGDRFIQTSTLAQFNTDTYINGEFSQGVSIANKVFTYGAEFRSSGASIQIVMGRDGAGSGSGAIGADENSIFSAWNVDSGASEKFRIDKSGNLFINQYIYHDGDTDTAIRFTDDDIQFNAGGLTMLKLTEGTTDEVVVNPDGANLNFRVEGDTDTNLIKTDASNNRVGIGTGSPDVKLHILNASEETIRLEGSNNTTAIHFFSGSNRTGILGHSNGTSIASAADAGDMVLRSESGKKVHIATGGANARLTVDAGGRIGMNNTAPSYRLDITNTSSEDANMAIRNSGTGHAGIWIDGSNGDLGGSDYAWIGQRNSSLLFEMRTAPNAGNIYLNPKDGAGAVDINGDLTVAGIVTAQEFHTEFVSASIIYQSGSTQFGNTLDDTHDFTGKLSILGNGADPDPEDYNNTLTLAVNAGPSGNDVGAGLFFKQKWFASSNELVNVGGIVGVKTNGSGTYGGGLAFYAQPASAADSFEVMRFNSSGKVGIGTTNPGTKLHVDTTTSTDGIKLSGTTNPRMMFASTSDVFSIGVPTGNGAYSTSAVVGDVVMRTNNAAGKILFSSGSGAATMTIAGGNVGIGTTSPSEKLHVVGNMTLEGVLEATEKSFNIEHPTKPGKRLIYGVLEGPEHGVYVRGKSTSKVIELPEVWTGLVHQDSLTVQLTCKGKPFQIWVEDIRDNKVYINTDVEEFEFYYYVQGERKDVDKLIIERDAD